MTRTQGERALLDMADDLDLYGAASAEGGRSVEARTFHVAAALLREKAEWGRAHEREAA